MEQAGEFFIDEQQLTRFQQLMEGNRRAVLTARIDRLGARLDGLRASGGSLLRAGAVRAEAKLRELRQVRTLAELQASVSAEAKLVVEKALANGVPIHAAEVESLKDHIFDRHLVLSERALRGLVEAEPALLQIDAESIKALPGAAAMEAQLAQFALANPGASWADLRMQHRRAFQQVFPKVRDFSDLVVELVQARVAPQIEQAIDTLAVRAQRIQETEALTREDQRFAEQANGWLGRRLKAHHLQQPLPERPLAERLKSKLTGAKPTLEQLEGDLGIDSAAPEQLTLEPVGEVVAPTTAQVADMDSRQVGERVLGLND